MKRIALLSCALAGFIACSQNDPPPAPTKPAAPKPAPQKPDAAATTPAKDGGADVRLGMMERHAIWLAKKQADEKLAKELAEAENKRLLQFDKSKLPKHLALMAFEKKLRDELDATAEKLKGKPDAAKEMEKVVNKQRKAVEAQAKILRAMDPTGGNSNIGTDHDVTLNALATDYPAALIEAFAGDEKPIQEMRAELDKRQKKMETWLAEAKATKK